METGVRTAGPAAGPGARTRNGALLGLLGLWLAYTRVFPAAVAAGVPLPVCPFLFLTGHPCPFCGGTRSFALMWRGAAGEAARLYPLGPALFLGSLLSLPVLAAATVFGRELNLAPRWRRPLGLAGGAVLGASWLLKLTALPN